MFERFDDAARRVVVYAQEECRVLGDDHIRTEHLLLAFFHIDDIDGAAARVLADAGVPADAGRAWCSARRAGRKRRKSGYVPFTSNVKQALEESPAVARRYGEDLIVPLAVLLAVLSVEESGAVAMLRDLDVDVAACRADAERALTGDAV